MTRKKPLLFNPDEEPKEMLIATFVIRQSLFEKVIKGIKNSGHNTTPQHFLLVGQRGMGKTTLLLRIKYAIEDDPQLSNYVIPVRFPEEQYQIGCLPDLWEETALYLGNMDPGFEGVLQEMQLHEKEDDYERVCFEILTKKLKQHNKKIVLLIDNIGDLLHKFTDQENHRLREILMTSPYIKLIGASSEMLEHNFQYDKPFFEFFYLLKLEPLNKDESVNLMRALAETYDVGNKISNIIKNTPHRIEALRRITGGVPRTLVLLFEIFIDYDDGSAFEDLEHLVDKVLPLYKARMDSLKPQQQKIVDALARAWEAISASDILEQSKLYRENITTNQVSSQLKQLEENQLVEVVDTGKRKKLYRIRERFFNIWYLMRNGRKQHKEQVLWLIRFLESWCTVEELQEIAHKQIGSLASGKYSEKAAYYKAVALHSIKCVDSAVKKHLLEKTEKYLIETKKHSWADAIHGLLDQEITNNWKQEAYTAFKAGDMKRAEQIQMRAVAKNMNGAEYGLALFYNDIEKDYEKAEEYYLKAVDKGDIDSLNSLAILYKKVRKDYDKAEDYYLKAIERGHGGALLNLANLYRDVKKDNAKAEEYYLMAIEKGYEVALLNIAILYDDIIKDYEKAEEYYLKAIEKGHVEALNNLAILYNDVKKNYGKAEEYYLKAIEEADVGALLNLAMLYDDVRKDYDKAEEYYLKAVEKGNVVAIFNIAHFYYDVRKNYEKAEEYYLKAVEKGNLVALFNLACLYNDVRKDYDKAEEYYLKAIENGNVDALNNLAVLYEDVRKDYDKAEEYYLKAIEKGGVGSLLNLAMLYDDVRKDCDKAEEYYLKAVEKGNVVAIFNIAHFYYNVRKDYEKAEEYYLMAIEKGDVDALFNLAYLYHNVRKDYEKAEKYYLKAIEKGDVDALFNLAYLYDDVRKDYDKAEEYYLKAIDSDNVVALFNLACLNYDERKDYDKAEEYYLRAIDKGVVEALNNLAILYGEVRKDYGKAEYYFLRAIAAGLFKASDYVFHLFWDNNQHLKALELCTNLFQRNAFFEKGDAEALQLLISILRKEQYNFLLDEFRKENSLLMKYMQPVYYVVAWYLKDELSGEYEKAGSEIKETVDEIIKRVERGKISA